MHSYFTAQLAESTLGFQAGFPCLPFQPGLGQVSGGAENTAI